MAKKQTEEITVSVSEEELRAFVLPRWDKLPEVDLYKDQVVSQIRKYLSFFEDPGTEIITPSMINNYVKWKIIEAPSRRKLYGKEQIASLIIVSLFKSVLPLHSICDMIAVQESISGMQKAYDDFCICFENCAKASVDTMQNKDRKEIEISSQTRIYQSASFAFLYQWIARQGIIKQQHVLKEASEQ